MSSQAPPATFRTARPAGPARAPATPARRPVAPVLVSQVRGSVVESRHRGHVVQADASGALIRELGDPDRIVNLRSAVKPFALVALLEAGVTAALDLTYAELAVMASSHSGEDLHVRTLQGILRRAGLSQTLLACGTDGAPLDALTSTRLARDGERPGAIRHMCSGAHAASLVLSKLQDWSVEDYWQPDHPSQLAVRHVVARAFGTRPDALITSIDQCGVLTYAFPLRDVARAYAFLADPEAVPDDDPRRSLAAPLLRIRDAMVAHPDLVGGSRDRLDTSLMKALPGRLLAKGGAEALRAIGILPGPDGRPASGVALKIEDGDGRGRASHAATVEVLRQVGVLEGQALRVLARYHRPASLDPHGQVAAEAIAAFELAPVGELIR